MMTSPWFWWLAAGTLLVLELTSGTFYLLTIALGCAAGGLVHLAGGSLETQCAVAAVVALVLVFLLRRSRLGRHQKRDASTDPDVNLDIGETLEVREWHDGRARVPYRGASWDIELAPGEPALAGLYEIRAVRGNCLVVAVHGTH